MHKPERELTLEEETNYIIHLFLGLGCWHTEGKESSPIGANYYCQMCKQGYNRPSIDHLDYCSDLNLLRPAEIKAVAEFGGSAYWNALRDILPEYMTDVSWEKVWAGMITAPADVRAAALRNLIPKRES